MRSRISSRSNSASAAKMPNTRRPAAVVVSICAPSPARTRRPTPAGRQVLHGVDQVGEVVAEAVELPDDEHVALPQGPQAAVESRPVVADAGGEVVIEVDRVVDARGPQGVALQVQRLGAVGLRDAGVADQHVSQTTVFDMESADPAGAALEFRPGGVPASQSPAPFVSGCSTRTPSPVRSPTPEFTPVNRARPALAAAPAGGAPEPLPRLEDGWWRTHGLPPGLER